MKPADIGLPAIHKQMESLSINTPPSSIPQQQQMNTTTFVSHCLDLRSQEMSHTFRKKAIEKVVVKENDNQDKLPNLNESSKNVSLLKRNAKNLMRQQRAFKTHTTGSRSLSISTVSRAKSISIDPSRLRMRKPRASIL